MSKATAQNAKERFYKFVSFRSKFSLFLSCIIFLCYYVFVASIAFAPNILGYRLGPSAITLGVMSGIFIIILCIVTTGIYTFFANKYLDKEQEEILQELEETGVIQDLQKGKI